MATATDNFNRADSAEFGTNWDVNTGTGAGGWDISANKAIPSTLSGDMVETWNANTFSDDQYALATIAAIAGTNNATGVGVGVRWAATDKTGYWVVCNLAASNDTTVARFSAGAYQQLAQRTAGWGVGDVVRLEISGTTLKVFRNGVQLGADIVNSDIAAGRVAVCFSSSMTDADLDDWEGGDLALTRTPSVGSSSVSGVASILGFALLTQSSIRE